MAMMTLANRPALADTREAVLKRTALNNAHREMFAIGDFKKLDKGLNRIQQEYEAGKWTDSELWKLFYFPLSATDPAFEELYNKWVSAYPASYAARQARGKYFSNRAVEVLQTVRKIAKVEKIDQMPPEEAARMKHFLELSIKDETASLSLAAKPLLAYCDLIAMYAFTGAPDTSRKMLDEANKIAPLNVSARHRYMSALDDSGANVADMRKVVEDARKSGLGEDDISSIARLFHARLLEEARYEELDREMTSVQQAYESGKIDDKTLEDYFSIFSNSNPAHAEKHNAWVKAYPRSYAARQARALYFLRTAWLARGGGYFKDMSPEERKGLELYMKHAQDDSKAAVSLTAKPLLAYESMLAISEVNGSHETSDALLELANTVDPKNSVVRARYMHALQTRWGGSLAQMEKFLAQAKAAGISDNRLMYFENLIVEEKFWLSEQADKAYPDLGELVTGF
ncbi:MAG: DUF4034 domain-containing protein [Pseudomonadota bacterium]